MTQTPDTAAAQAIEAENSAAFHIPAAPEGDHTGVGNKMAGPGDLISRVAPPLGEYVICDLRPEWRRMPYVTFWRPDDAGYAYPLSWAGDYSEGRVREGRSYYTARKGRSLIRFAVLREVAERYSHAPTPGMIDGDAGPVVGNTPENRKALRSAALVMV